MADLHTSTLLYDGFLLAHRNLENHLDLLNMINVFPIADKDTGSNMEQSMRKVAEGLTKDLGTVALLKTAAAILLESGRGNSGTILTLFFEGLANALTDGENISQKNFVDAVTAGAKLARDGIANPKEGTILTVCAKAAEVGYLYYENNKDCTFSQLMNAIADEAFAALPKTAEENEALQKYGVIDSGAFGFCMILDAFAAAFSGVDFVSRSYEEMADKAVDATASQSQYQYCTELVVDKPKNGYDKILKEEMERLGDCIIPVTDKNHLKLHIHTNHPEAVLFVASLCGNLKMTKIDNMTLQSKGEKEEIAFYCHASLTKDGLLSMGYENVFCEEENMLAALKEYVGETRTAETSVTVFTSLNLPAGIEKNLKKIRYFGDDESMLDYLFSQKET